jgi:hypothetical protein
VTEFSSILGEGILALWFDVDPSRRDEVDRWHIHEHFPERVSVPGFLRARRYERIGATPRPGADFLTLYEVQTVDVLASPAYLARLDNPTPLTRQSVPLMVDMRRSALRVVSARGRGVGGYLSVFEFLLTEDRSTELRRSLATEVLSRALEPVAVIAAHLLEPEIAATQAKDSTAEGKATNTVTEVPPWVLLVEAVDERGLQQAETDVLDDLGGLEAVGKAVDRYRLTVTLSPPDGSPQ